LSLRLNNDGGENTTKKSLTRSKKKRPDTVREKKAISSSLLTFEPITSSRQIKSSRVTSKTLEDLINNEPEVITMDQDITEIIFKISGTVEKEVSISGKYLSDLFYEGNQLLGGTFRAVIYWMARTLVKQKFHIISLILAHQIYVTSHEFLHILIELYEEKELNRIDTTQKKNSFVQIIKNWFK